MKESDLYRPVKDALEQLGYEVYAEVEYGSGGKRADVVGYQHPAVCVVEMKTSLTMDLIEQAYKWLPYAHHIYIAIPARKKDVPSFVSKLLHQFGIGIMQVTPRGRVVVTQRAKFNRPRHASKWKKILRPEHQTWLEGGSQGGGYVTPYKLTIERVRQYLSRNPHRWFTIREILDHCETHYASPKNSLSKALREFEHDWCESKIDDRKLYFRLRGR
jgi:hypothetical protein